MGTVADGPFRPLRKFFGPAPHILVSVRTFKGGEQLLVEACLVDLSTL